MFFNVEQLLQIGIKHLRLMYFVLEKTGTTHILELFAVVFAIYTCSPCRHFERMT